MRFPSPKQVEKRIINKELKRSIDYLINNQDVIKEFSNIEDFVLRDEEYTTNSDASPDILQACEHHLLVVRNKLITELRARNFFIGLSVLDETLFYAIKKIKDENLIISTLETIRDSGALHPGFVIYPLHSLGLIYGGIIQSFSQSEINFNISGIDISISPQTNSFEKSIKFIKRSSEYLGIKRKIPIDLLEHWHRSRSLKWLERNPLLIAKIHSFPGDYYENQFYITNKLKIATTLILMFNSLQNFHSPREGYLLSSSRTNNWETLDIRHYLLFYPKLRSPYLTGDCIPMNVSRPTLTELSEVPAELDIKFWNRRNLLAKELTELIIKIELGYYKYVVGKSKSKNHVKIYRKVYKSLEFYRRSYRKKDDPGEAIINLSVAFEILLSDNYERGIYNKILDRCKKLLKGVKGVRTFIKSISELFENRGEYVHSGFLGKDVDIKGAQFAYIYILMKFSPLLVSIRHNESQPIAKLLK